jgi:hypothetical protein
MSSVCVDTVGIMALQERSDQWHEAAAQAWAVLLQADRALPGHQEPDLLRVWQRRGA